MSPLAWSRAAGVLLHPPALGCQALGAPAHRFVDWLAAAGVRYWQMLPLGPVGTDGSPYWVHSDHAGNAALAPPVDEPGPRALARFRCAQAGWLDDYALHQALARRHGASWLDWPLALRDRHASALAAAARLLARETQAVEQEQWAFETAWQALRRHAHRRGVRLIGDLPMYVAPDAVDTWRHREEYCLGADGKPSWVAGVPPDYFSHTGQLWGNPLYDWPHAAANGFMHFRRRVRSALRRVDLLRIDHFRALAAHWVVPAAAPDARAGHWRATPGGDLLAALRTDWPDMPFIAEDLGDITPDVIELRDRFGLPGMQVLQFAFDGDPRNAHRPEQAHERQVVYLGTHDNDTTLGWMTSLDSETLRRACGQLGVPPRELPRALRRALLASRAGLAVLTVPDILGLGSEARYNTPGSTQGNWCWQVPEGALTPDLARTLRSELEAHGRV